MKIKEIIAEEIADGCFADSYFACMADVRPMGLMGKLY
jgi:hypothetical protein